MPRLDKRTEDCEPIRIGEAELPVKAEKVVIYDRLPEPQEGVLYIVPQEVAEAADGRDDLAYPHFELVNKGLVAVTELRKPAR